MLKRKSPRDGASPVAKPPALADMPSDARLSVRLPATLKNAVKMRADHEGKGISEEVVSLLWSALQHRPS